MSKTEHANTIAVNRKARHDYFIEETYEVGMVLQGWEVKSLRAAKANLTDSYVLLKNGEAWLLGCNISPLPTVSTHVHPDPTRTRKLLLNQRSLINSMVVSSAKAILPSYYHFIGRAA